MLTNALLRAMVLLDYRTKKVSSHRDEHFDIWLWAFYLIGSTLYIECGNLMKMTRLQFTDKECELNQKAFS